MAVSAIVAAISTASATLAGGVAALTFSFGLTGIAGIASHFLITTALGAALSALAPKASAGGIGGYAVNAVGSDLDRQVVYGQTRTGSAVIYSDTFGSSNVELEQVHVFTGHPIEEFVEWYIDGNRVTDLDPATGNVKEVELQDGTLSTLYNNYAFIKDPRLGHETTPAFPKLIARYDSFENPEDYWNDKCTLTGCAAVNFVAVWNTSTNIWPNGLPNLEAVIKGKKVLDPRTGLVEWSDNAALCIADFLTADYGLDEDPARVDLGMVATAANVCDQTNTPGGEKRYSFNGAFITNVTPNDFLASALTAMGGSLWYSQGKWRLKPAYWTEPRLSLTDDDLRGPIDLNTRHSRRDNFNQIKGTYRGPETFYQVTNYPAITNHTATSTVVLPTAFVVGQYYQIRNLGVTTDWNAIAGTEGFTYQVGQTVPCVNVPAGGDGDAYTTYDLFLDIDGGQRSAIALDLPFVDNQAQAKRLARIALERNREQLTVSLTTNLKSMELQVGDNFQFTHERFGWDHKTFEIVAWGFAITDDLEPLISITAREVSEAVFDDKDDGEKLERNNTRLPNPFQLDAPTGLSFSSTEGIDTDGKTVSDITFEWTHVEPLSVTYYELEFRKKGRVHWQSAGLIRNPNHLLDNVSSRDTWEWRVRATNALGQVSLWALGSDAAGNPDTTIPEVPTALTGLPGYRSVKITWQDPTTNVGGTVCRDLDHSIVRRNDDPSKDVFVSGNSFTDNGLSPAGTYSYKVAAVDKTGNQGAFTSSISVTALADPADGVDGISVLVVYADDAVGTNQSLNPLSYEYVNYYEYNTSDGQPALPLPGGTTFVKFIGVGQSIFPIYADDALGNNQSFTQGLRPYVNFFESPNATAPTLPQAGLTFVRVAADDGNNGSDSYSIYISADDQTITYDSKGEASPTTQTFNFEAITSNTGANTINWTTLPNVKSGSGTTFTLTQNDFGTKYWTATKKVTVTATVSTPNGNITDKTTVYALKQGSGGITPVLTNESVSVASDSDGSNPDLLQTDTGILVFDGDTQLTAVSNSPVAGQFTVNAINYVGCAGNASGTVSGGTYTLGDLTAFTDNDKGYRDITLRVRPFDGSGDLYIQRRQSFTKAKAGSTGSSGARGPGRWDIVLPVGVPLPNTGSGSFRVYWNTYGRTNGNVAPVQPVLNDQAWYRTSTGEQAVGICTSVSSNTNHSWQEQDEVVDGNLLVTGSLNVMNAAIGGTVQSNNFVSGQAGWQIRDTGAAEFNGPVISRQIRLVSNTITLPGTHVLATAGVHNQRYSPVETGSVIPGANGEDSEGWYRFVNLGVRLGVEDVWQPLDQTLAVTAAIVDPNFGSISAAIDPYNTFWSTQIQLEQGAARWFGYGGSNPDPHFSYQGDPSNVVNLPGATDTSQRLLARVRFFGKSNVNLTMTNPVIRVSVYKII